MKCGQLQQSDLARAYQKAVKDAAGGDVTMEHLAPHLKETGSSCGACPALLPLAKKAFEGLEGEMETTRDVVREAVHEIVPDLRAFTPKGA